MAGKVIDSFANIATIDCLESAANTLTYKKLETGISTFEKVAWVIHRIDYNCTSLDAAVFNANGDGLSCALMTGNQRSSILTTSTFSDPTVIDVQFWFRRDLGAAASGNWVITPDMKDFSGMPGGGIIVPPIPIYGAIMGVGLVSAAQVIMRLYYTTKELSPDEYWQLVEARRIISA